MGTSYQFRQSQYIVQLQPQPTPEDPNCPPAWRAKATLTPEIIYGQICEWLSEQRALIEAFWVAVTFHVLLFPLIWFVGWAFPWPKSPTITTVIEINLENWPNEAHPEKIEQIYNYELSKARKKSQ